MTRGQGCPTDIRMEGLLGVVVCAVVCGGVYGSFTNHHMIYGRTG